MGLEINIKPCPCCASTNFFEVVGFKNIPASGVFRSKIDESQLSYDLYFDACLNCGLLRRRDFFVPPDYTDRPRSTKNQLPRYCDDILNQISSLAKQDDLIAEVGSNDGTFLHLLAKAGYKNTFGIEPSLALSTKSMQSGLRINNSYFSPEIVSSLISTYGDVNLVICRHTLEHVPFPEDFIAALRDLLKVKRGVAFIEVPDSAVVTDWFNFMELWDEHLHYFTESTLELLLNRQGFCIQNKSTFSHLDTRNILIQATLRDVDIPVVSTKNQESVTKWNGFSQNLSLFTEKFQSEIAKFPRPIYFIGASHPQCNFINYLGIGEFVDFMIDDDCDKAGKYPPISSSKTHIISTDEFFACSSHGTLVLTGFGYPSWTDKLAQQALLKSMKIFDPKLLAEF